MDGKHLGVGAILDKSFEAAEWRHERNMNSIGHTNPNRSKQTPV